MRIRESRYASMFVCDACGKPIEDNNAIAIHPDDPTEGEFGEVLHAHKGSCDDKLTTRMGGVAKTGWREISQHIVQLAANIGMTGEDFEGEAETMAEMRLFNEEHPPETQ